MKASGWIRRWWTMGTVLALGVGAVATLAILLLSSSRTLTAIPESDRRQVYTLALDTKTDAPSGQVVHFALKGDLVMQRVNKDEVAMFVSDAQLTSNQATPEAQPGLDQGAKELAHPLVIKLGENGLIAEVKENERLRLQVRSMLRSIAALLQYSPSGAANASSWEKSENDVMGQYAARYEQVGTLKVEKQKLAYTELLGASAGALAETPSIKVQNSKHVFTFRKDQVLRSLTVAETLTTDGGMLGGLVTTTSLTLQLKDVGQPRALEIKGQPVVSLLHELRKSGVFSIEADRAQTGGKSYSEMMEGLEAIPVDDATPEQGAQRTLAVANLAALFRLDATAVKESLEAVEDGSPQARRIWDALASSGSPEAQAALRKIIDMPQWTEDERRAQMIGLSLGQRPTQATVDFFVDKFDEPEHAVQARYGVGITVNKQLQTDPNAARRGLAILVEDLNAAQTDGDKAVALVAIGNTGHPDALGIIGPYTVSDSDQLRASAADAVRLIPGNEAEAMLTALAMHDGSFRVRVAAVDSLGGRPATEKSLSTLYTVATVDSLEQPRSRARAVLDSMSLTDRAALPILEAVVAYDRENPRPSNDTQG